MIWQHAIVYKYILFKPIICPGDRSIIIGCQWGYIWCYVSGLLHLSHSVKALSTAVVTQGIVCTHIHSAAGGSGSVLTSAEILYDWRARNHAQFQYHNVFLIWHPGCPRPSITLIVQNQALNTIHLCLYLASIEVWLSEWYLSKGSVRQPLWSIMLYWNGDK